MPVYEYECAHCGVIEVSQSIKDDRLSKCPKCRRKVKRLISLNNFVLKGSGWYTTDYARKNGPNGKSAEKKPSTDAPAETKSETKCDSKSQNDSCKTCPKATEAS